MRDARHPRSHGEDSVCGRRPEQANPQGQRGRQWSSGAGGGGQSDWLWGRVSLWDEENVLEPDRGGATNVLKALLTNS